MPLLYTFSYIKEEKQCGNARTAVYFLCHNGKRGTIVFLLIPYSAWTKHALHVQIKIIKYKLLYTYMYIIPIKLFIISFKKLS